MSAIQKYTDGFRQSSVGKWFYGREVSEQRIILGLTCLVVVSLLWVSVWQPVSEWRDFSVNRQHNAQNLADWLKLNEATARKSAAKSPQRQKNSITPLITRAAAAHEITVNRLQNESNGIVSVSLQQQSFNKIIAWVAQMEENNKISIERASIDSVEAQGYVNAQLRLN